MDTKVFFLGSHPALSAAELAAYAERHHLSVSWDLSRLPVALLGHGVFPAARLVPQSGEVRSTLVGMQEGLGGTTMIGTLRATLGALPKPAEVFRLVPEILERREGKRLIGLSALPCPTERVGSRGTRAVGADDGEHGTRAGLADEMRRLSMELKRAMDMKGTRVVFPPARRSDLSTAQLYHNDLPQHGTAIFFLVGPERVDLVTIDSIQDITAYAQRDRGRPAADPGSGMLPPKVAQMFLNFSLTPPGGTVYDPFCGVGTIPMEAALMGLTVIASDVSPTQVERTRANLEWLRHFENPLPHFPEARLFVHDITKGAVPIGVGVFDGLVTEGWLGPARTTAVLPHDAENVFTKAGTLLAQLLHTIEAAVRGGGRAVIALPAFRSKRRVFHFPLERLRTTGWVVEPLVPAAWIGHPLFRSGQRGTLLYGRPDAHVLREIVRFRLKRKEERRTPMKIAGHVRDHALGSKKDISVWHTRKREALPPLVVIPTGNDWA